VASQPSRTCARYHVAGRFDYLLHVAVRDPEHLGRPVKYDIAAITGVDKAETMLVYSEVKPDDGWPFQPEGPEEWGQPALCRRVS
jgi:DNA-binding Lrp family transcriptional regulator